MHVVHGLLYFVTLFLVCMNFKTKKNTSGMSSEASTSMAGVILSNRVFHGLALCQKSIGRYQTGQLLIRFPFTFRLPPVGIFLIYDMENISFDETDSKIPAWYIHVVFWIVIDMGLGKKFKNVTNYTFSFPELKNKISSIRILK